MSLTMRPYHDETDYWQVRQFLRLLTGLNGQLDRSWNVVRFDYWRWHVHENIEHFRLNEVAFVWTTDDGQIVAMINPDSRGDAYLQVHPAYRTPELEEEMICMAEARLAIPAAEGGRTLNVWANDDDAIRREVLKRRGFLQGDWPEYQRRRPMEMPIPAVKPPAGYVVRALGDVNELPARSYLSWQAFHPNEPEENYQGWTWYHNIQRAPLYRRDLDLVAVAADGEFASFCTVWFDDVNRVGIFEPVGTAPQHQRRGLSKAVMTEGLRRLKRLGATLALVGAYSESANALYNSVGFTEYDLLERWVVAL